MLKRLTISNYALIGQIEIEFPKNLIIITGETGAGKSIMLGALSLLSGAKTDKSIFRESEKNCVVEAIFETDNNGINEEIILRKVINPSGKSRSFINDEPVTSQQLKEKTAELFDIHEQHHQLLLSDSNFQLSVLDSFSNHKDLLKKYKEEYSNLQELIHAKTRLREQIAEEERELEFNKFQHSRLEEAKLDEEEFLTLEQEYNLLSHSEEIKSTLYNIVSLLTPAGLSITQNLKEAKNLSDKISRSLEQATEISQRLESCKLELDDLENELVNTAEKITHSPERLLLVEERLSLINNLLKLHHTNSIAELIEIRESLSKKIESNSDHHEQYALLEKRYTAQLQQVTELASKLSDSRIRQVQKFDKELTTKIQDLEMADAKFQTAIEKHATLTPTGIDTVRFLFSANKNVTPAELSKVASGGELSRIMLCLKMIMSINNNMPTMIFDEIDTGVSGKIADKMGKLIEEMSHTMQIIAITHLPQIASKGEFHLLVHKVADNQERSETKIREISLDERVYEIARMLSGSKITEAATANAKELLASK